MNVVADDPATGAVDPATDADGDTITVTAVGAATNGTTAVSATQSANYTSTANYDGSDSFNVTISDGRGATATTTVSVSAISPFRWVGLGADTNWNTNLNWCGAINITTGACAVAGGSPPGGSDVAYFGPWAATKNATINVPISIKGIEARTGYTGTITQNASQHIVLGSNGFILNSGTFVGSNNVATNFSILDGGLILKAGTNFTAPSGTLKLDKTILYAVKPLEFLGNFTHNNGTILLDSSSIWSGGIPAEPHYSIDVATSVDFYKLIFNLTNLATAGIDPAKNYLDFLEDTDKVRVMNDLTFNAGGSADGTIELFGNLYASCASAGACAFASGGIYPTRIKLVGSTNTTYTVTDQTLSRPRLGRILVSKNANTTTVSSSDNREIQFASLEIESGEFIAPSGNFYLGKAWSYPVAFDVVYYGFSNTGGIFTHNSGSLNLVAETGSTSSGPGALLIPMNFTTPVTVNNLIQSYVVYSPAAYMKRAGTGLVNNSVLNVLGNLTINHGFMNGGTINLYGNLVVNCSDPTLSCGQKHYTRIDWGAPFGYLGPTAITFKGSAPQTYAIHSSAYAPGIVVDKIALADTVSPVGASSLNASFIDVRQGTLTLSSGTTKLGNYGAGCFNDDTGLSLAAGAGNGAIVHNGGTVIFDSSSSTTCEGNYTGRIATNGRSLSFNNFTIKYVRGPYVSSGIAIVPSDKVTILGNFTVEAGSIFLNDLSIPTTPSFDIYGNVQLNCSNVATYNCAMDAKVFSSSATVGVMATLKGNSKTISQTANAAFVFRKLQVDLTDNTQYVTMLSNLDAQRQSPHFGPYADVLLKTGNLDKNGFSFSNISNLDVTAGFMCNGVLGYSTSSGATGSGCGP